MKHDITGQKFHKLTVLGFSHTNDKGAKHWRCRCDCGNELVVRRDSITSGNTKGCGCSPKGPTSGHRLSRDPEHRRTYASWKSMMDRGCNKDSKYYARYGARGITVCPEWHDYVVFEQDMGLRPQGTTIDRIDNAKGYFPGNCRWATPLQQVQNRAVTRWITYNGETLTHKEWADRLGLTPRGLTVRLIKNSLHDVMTSPRYKHVNPRVKKQAAA